MYFNIMVGSIRELCPRLALYQLSVNSFLKDCISAWRGTGLQLSELWSPHFEL